MGDVEVQMQVSTSATEKKVKKVKKTTTKKSTSNKDGTVEYEEHTTTEVEQQIGKENLPEVLDGETYTYLNYNYLNYLSSLLISLYLSDVSRDEFFLN